VCGEQPPAIQSQLYTVRVGSAGQQYRQQEKNEEGTVEIQELEVLVPSVRQDFAPLGQRRSMSKGSLW